MIVQPLRQAIRNKTPIRYITAISIQVSIFAIVAVGVLQPKLLIVTNALPPLTLLSPIIIPRSYYANFTGAFTHSISLSITCLAATLIVLMPFRIRKYSLLPALVVALSVLVYHAEKTSKANMETALGELAGECFVRSPIWISSKFGGEDFQWDLHAVTIKDDKWYGWSYRSMGFYPLPASYAGDGNGKMKRCLEQIRLLQ